MLDVLGLDPLHAALGRRRGADAARDTVGRSRPCSTQRAAGARPQGLRDGRRRTRPAQGRRASRSRTPRPGTRWTLAGELMGRATASATARSARPARATRPPAPAAGAARSGGQGPDAARPTSGRPQGLPAAQGGREALATPATSSRAAPRRGGDSEWVAGRNAVVEALRARVPVTSLYVAERIERDDRIREVFRTAAEQGIGLIEVPARRARPAHRRRGAPGHRRQGPAVRLRAS